MLSVLYVEDHPSNVHLVERLLARRPSSELHVAATGREGLRLAALLRPDVVLLDLNLPDLAGEVVLDRLWALPGLARTPVVVLTADATAATAARLRDRGVAGHLTKPLDVAAFYARLDDVESRLRRLRIAAC